MKHACIISIRATSIGSSKTYKQTQKHELKSENKQMSLCFKFSSMKSDV